MKLSISEIIKQAPKELLDKKYSAFFQRRLLCTFKRQGNILLAPPFDFSWNCNAFKGGLFEKAAKDTKINPETPASFLRYFFKQNSNVPPTNFARRLRDS